MTVEAAVAFGAAQPAVRLFSDSVTTARGMKQQTDRLDPMVESPPSILDRKHELSRW